MKRERGNTWTKLIHCPWKTLRILFCARRSYVTLSTYIQMALGALYCLLVVFFRILVVAFENKTGFTSFANETRKTYPRTSRRHCIRVEITELNLCKYKKCIICSNLTYSHIHTWKVTITINESIVNIVENCESLHKFCIATNMLFYRHMNP